MNIIKTCGILGIFASSALAEPETARLERQIEELRLRVAELSAQQTRLSDKELRRTIDQVLDDADRRSHWLAAEGFTAGWDNGFWLKSADGNYAMKLGLLFQPRFVMDYREGGGSGLSADSDTQAGFEIKRTQFIVSGNAFTPDLTYNFMWESPQGGGLGLLDAFVSYKFADDFAMKFGQYFDPLSRETLNGPPRRLGVEASLVDFYLAGGLADRVQGMSLIYGLYKKDNPLYVEVMVHDGAKSRNTNFEDDPSSGNFGFAARVEAKCFGDWSSYKDLTAAGNKNDLLAFGAGVDFTEADNRQQWLASVDGQWESGALALFAAVNLRYVEQRNEPQDDSFFDYGGLVQAAYLVNEHFEVFGRYGFIEFDEPVAGTDSAIHEVVAGVNWYVQPSTPHRAKVTFDLTYLPNGGGPGAKGLGIAGGDDDDEIVLRGQFQLFL
ncbi:MAG TPA: porin [Tepidisphaeraceae bacterium]|mgnify:FL=1|nr:porin [Tepidisphaeraceae bacterium]